MLKPYYTIRRDIDKYRMIYHCLCGACIIVNNNNTYKHKNSKRCIDYHFYFVNI